MTEQRVEIKDIAIRLLTPNDTLDVRVFDTHKKMYSELRKTLLSEANFVYNRCLGGIEGLKVDDIYLNGSSASYFYYDGSDLDMRINVSNIGCPYITNNREEFEAFMSAMKNGAFPDTSFKAGNRLVDIKFSSHNFEIVGLYSILQDKWVVEPRKDIVEGLDVADTMEEYTRRFYAIKDYMREMVESDKMNTIEGAEEVEQYYKNCILRSSSSIREYILFKLLNYRGIHKQLRELFNDSLKAALTLK